MHGTKPAALVTNAAGFAGPPAVDALLAAGFRVLAHDRSFGDDAVWAAYGRGRGGLDRIDGDTPEACVDQAFALCDTLSALVSNDHYPAPLHDTPDVDPDVLRANFEALVAFPFALVRAALPRLYGQGRANIVLITSNRMRLPMAGAAIPEAVRAAGNGLVRPLAVECAPHGVVVNAIAPNFLYSEAYYPNAVFRDTEAGRRYIADSVPVGRLADPAEIGEVIAFFATVKSRFMTGAVVDFSGGWPFGTPRPEAGD